MKRLKTFGKYILWLVLFFVFSRVIIFIGLNSTSKNIESQNQLPQDYSVESTNKTTEQNNLSNFSTQ